MPQPLSVVVITFNEAENIERCIRSVAGIADEVLVVDSLSTDATPELARSLGARVELRPWPGYALQREWAAQQAAHDWVLALDADEYLSPELRASILLVKSSPQADAYSFNRLNRIGQYWVRHGGWYPDRKLRLFDRRKVRFMDAGGHDTIQPAAGATQQWLPGDLLHHANTDIHSRLAQVNKLGTDSARYLFQNGKRSSWWKVVFKPPFRFVKEYILRRGFLDGFYGVVIAVSSAQYVFWREFKIMELQRKREAN